MANVDTARCPDCGFMPALSEAEARRIRAEVIRDLFLRFKAEGFVLRKEA